jgi:hypothetical protein
LLEIKHILPGEWRKLHNKEPNDLYSSPKIDWVIKSRRMRWAGHVECMGEKRGVYREREEKRPRGRPRLIDERIILKCIFRRGDMGV